MYSCWPLSTHHVPSAGCSSLPFFLSKKPLAGDSHFLFFLVLFLRFGSKKSTKSREKVDGERSELDGIPQRRHSVREQGQSLTAATQDADTQISGEDYCPGSACVLVLLLQIDG